MVLSQEIDIKLCQIYTKIHIYAMFYKSRFKEIIFSKKRKQSENNYIPQKLENLRFAPILIFILFIFLFLFILILFPIFNRYI